MGNKTYDIKERALEFAARAAKFAGRMPRKSQAALEYGKQLIRASASIGANMEEADGALTRRDFVNKVGIARRESRESRYWSRLIEKAELVIEEGDKRELGWLRNEASEIMLILSSIINKASKGS